MSMMLKYDPLCFVYFTTKSRLHWTFIEISFHAKKEVYAVMNIFKILFLFLFIFLIPEAVYIGI